MITLRRAKERHHVRSHRQDIWLTFNPEDRDGPLGDGFGALELLEEDVVPPGAALLPYAQPEAEVVTYLLEGALAQSDSSGFVGVVHTGEFQRLIANNGARHRSANASRTEWAHAFQMWLRPAAECREPSHFQKRFSVAERRGTLFLVASPDGQKGSLQLHEDVRIYSAILDSGQHVVHELGPQRMAWLHVASGQAALADHDLHAGDGAGIAGERCVSLTAREETEILLVDVVEQPLKDYNRRGAA